MFQVWRSSHPVREADVGHASSWSGESTGHLLGRNCLISQGSVSKFFRVSAVNTGSSFAPFASLREARAGSLAKIAKGAKETFCLPLRKSGTSIKI